MKKNFFFKFSLIFVLQAFLSLTLQAKNDSGDNEILTQPLKLCWSYQPDNFLETTTASDNEFVFIGLSNGKVEAINSKTGKVEWSTELGGKIISNLVSNVDKLYVLSETTDSDKSQDEAKDSAPTKSGLSLRSINSVSGIVNWNVSIPVTNPSLLKFLAPDRLLLITRNGDIVFIDSRKGEISKEYKTGKEISVAEISQETIIIGTADKKIILNSLADTRQIEEFSVPEVPQIAFQSESGKIIWADGKGNLNALDGNSNKRLWTKKFGAAISSVRDIPQGLLVTCLDNFVYLISKDSGNIVWKRRLAARVTEKPFVKDNFTVIAAFGDSSAFILDLKKGKIVNSVSLSDANYFTGNPVFTNNILIFPTLKGLFAYGGECAQK